MERAGPRRKIRGWALKVKLDKEKKEERRETKTGPTLTDAWMGRSGSDQRLTRMRRERPPQPILDDGSTIDELEDEIEWIQTTDKHTQRMCPSHHYLCKIQEVVD